MPKRQFNDRWKSEYMRLRRERAAEIDAPRKARSDEEQLRVISERPGNSAKETARLQARINEA